MPTPFPILKTPSRACLPFVQLAGLVFFPCAAFATDAPAPLLLDSLTVKGSAMQQATDKAYSTTLIEANEIRQEHVDQVQDLLRKVPGMNVRDLGLPGVADNISLRGFGNGGHGGDIGFIVDGIPLNEAMSHADGYADLNLIVPLELERIKVLRGPVSALYGNYNRAGSVTLQTRRGGDYRELDLSAGEYGKVDLQAAAGFEYNGNQRINLAAQAVHDDGFRDQSQSERQTFAGRWAIDFSPALEVALSTRLHQAEADNPSYLPYAEYKRDPYGKYAGVQNDGSEKDYRSLRLDANYRLADDLKLLSFLYTTRQDFSRWFTRPVAGTWSQREETYDRAVLGGGFNLNGQGSLAERPVNWVAGVESYRERTDYLKHDGIHYRQRNATPDLDRRFTLNNLAAFGELEWQIDPLFTPTLGWRWDRFTGDCAIQGAETVGGECARLAPVSHASPKFSLRSRPADWLELRASWAEGFALAEETAKYSLGAARVDPNVFRQTEVGANLVWGDLSLDLALYRIDSTDEIGENPAGEYENFGETRRTGFEAAGHWYLSDSFDLSLAWATAQSEIRRNADPALEGNRVTGVPSHTTTLTANWRPVADWEGSLTWRQIGDYALDAANRQITGGYHVADLSIAHTLAFAPGVRTYLAVENLTDEVYAAAVSTIGYASGAPRRVSLGVQASL